MLRRQSFYRLRYFFSSTTPIDEASNPVESITNVESKSSLEESNLESMDRTFGFDSFNKEKRTVVTPVTTTSTSSATASSSPSSGKVHRLARQSSKEYALPTPDPQIVATLTSLRQGAFQSAVQSTLYHRNKKMKQKESLVEKVNLPLQNTSPIDETLTALRQEKLKRNGNAFTRLFYRIDQSLNAAMQYPVEMSRPRVRMLHEMSTRDWLRNMGPELVLQSIESLKLTENGILPKLSVDNVKVPLHVSFPNAEQTTVLPWQKVNQVFGEHGYLLLPEQMKQCPSIKTSQLEPGYYTLLVLDADMPNEVIQSVHSYLLFAAMNIHVTEQMESVDLTSATTPVLPWLSPAPARGSGSHRLMALLFKQPNLLEIENALASLLIQIPHDTAMPHPERCCSLRHQWPSDGQTAVSHALGALIGVTVWQTTWTKAVDESEEHRVFGQVVPIQQDIMKRVLQK